MYRKLMNKDNILFNNPSNNKDLRSLRNRKIDLMIDIWIEIEKCQMYTKRALSLFINF